MAKAGEIGNRATQQQNIAGQIPNLPGDFLQRFTSSNQFSLKTPKNGEEECEDEEIELSLGLSLNGRFGIDPRAKNKLTRSSSIPEDFINKLKAKQQDGDKTAFLVPRVSLLRTCSLPMETEEEWRKRKELQSLNRMEAKRKRLDKQRAVKEFRTAVTEEGFAGELQNKIEEQGVQNYCFAPGWVDGRGGGCKVETCGEKGNDHFAPIAVGWRGGCRVEARGEKGNILCSVRNSYGGSRGSSGSSAVTEMESHQIQATNKNSQSRNPASSQSSPKNNAWTTGEKNPLNGSEASIKAMGVRELMARNIRENMPCVSTKGKGPDGKRIQGFLYRYRKGEEVRIVCVCHGNFLSPAEFVKHGGGGDVVNPLRHIIVNSSSIF